MPGAAWGPVTWLDGVMVMGLSPGRECFTFRLSPTKSIASSPKNNLGLPIRKSAKASDV